MKHSHFARHAWRGRRIDCAHLRFTRAFRGVGACAFNAIVALALSTSVAFSASAAPLKMYKWVDENGVTHYTDKLPADAVDKASSELSKEGVTIKKTEPNASPADRRGREAEAERQKQEAKEQQETARHDRAVLDSYTSEEDIDFAKNRAVRTMEQALQSAQNYVAQLTKRKEAMVAAKINDKAAQANTERELARLDSDIDHQNEFISRKKVEMANSIAKYESDKERWRAAKARETQRSAQTAPPARTVGSTQGSPVQK